MATFVMMSMVFTVVLLKSAALATDLPKDLPKDPPTALPKDPPTALPKDPQTALPKAYTVEDWTVPEGTGTPRFKAWADVIQFFGGDNLTFPNADVERVATKAAYEECDVDDKLENQFTEANETRSITLNSATEYYFISPNFENCTLGQKLTVSVSNAPRPAASVGVLVPMMAVVMGFFF